MKLKKEAVELKQKIKGNKGEKVGAESNFARSEFVNPKVGHITPEPAQRFAQRVTESFSGLILE